MSANGRKSDVSGPRAEKAERFDFNERSENRGLSIFCGADDGLDQLRKIRMFLQGFSVQRILIDVKML
jgi:hypothetical protein